MCLDTRGASICPEFRINSLQKDRDDETMTFATVFHYLEMLRLPHVAFPERIGISADYLM